MINRRNVFIVAANAVATAAAVAVGGVALHGTSSAAVAPPSPSTAPVWHRYAVTYVIPDFEIEWATETDPDFSIRDRFAVNDIADEILHDMRDDFDFIVETHSAQHRTTADDGWVIWARIFVNVADIANAFPPLDHATWERITV
jgi:hypothetical protein